MQIRYPRKEKIEDLTFIFKKVPSMFSFKYAFSFLKKISKTIESSCDSLDSTAFKKEQNEENIIMALVPLLAKGQSSLISSFEYDEIIEIIENHLKYIKIQGKQKEEDLNLEYHFDDRPEMYMLLLIKIIEVYYASFFTKTITTIRGVIVKKMEQFGLQK